MGGGAMVAQEWDKVRRCGVQKYESNIILLQKIRAHNQGNISKNYCEQFAGLAPKDNNPLQSTSNH